MKESEILKRIYPSVVTFVGDWQEMIKDVAKFKLTEISLFLTDAGITERKKIYQALKEARIKKISHVHLRHDMRESELDFLVSQYKTKAFTAHCRYYLRYFKTSKHQKNIFIENNNGQSKIKDLSVLKQVGGVCIDLAHLEHFRRHSPKDYNLSLEAAENYFIGCNHLSAVLANGKSWHRVKKLSDLDYVKNIPQKYFSQYINLELANPISQQLEFRNYLAEILAKQWNKRY